MKRILYTIFLIVTSFNLLHAQSDEAIKDKITAIKRDVTNYLYGESQSSSQEEATLTAKKQLTDNIKLWVKSILPQEDINSVAAKNIDNYTDTLFHMRGKVYRVLVYVNKNDIYALLPVNKVAQSSEKNVQKKIEDDVALKSDETSVSRNEDLHSVPQVENIKESELDNIKSYNTHSSKSKTEGIVSELLKASNISEVKRILNNENYKSKYYYFNVNYENDYNEIKQKGAILVIYHRSNKNINAIIKPYNNNGFINLKTNQQETLNTYPDCNAIAIAEIN